MNNLNFELNENFKEEKTNETIKNKKTMKEEKDIKTNEQPLKEEKTNKMDDFANLGLEMIEAEDVVAKSTFTPNIEVDNGLNIAYISNVYIKEVEIKKENSMFCGKMMPKLCIEFASDPRINKESVPRFYTHEITPVQTVENYMLIFKSQIADKLSHIFSAYTKNKFKYMFWQDAPISVDVDTVLKVYKKLFEDAEKFAKENNLVETEASVEQGKAKYVWLKLIANKRGDKLEFPYYIGQGFIERRIKGLNPSIRINVEKGETTKLTPKVKNNSAGILGGAGIDLSDINMSSGSLDINIDDMPAF